MVLFHNILKNKIRGAILLLITLKDNTVTEKNILIINIMGELVARRNTNQI